MGIKKGRGRPIKLENGLECGKSTTNPGMYEDSAGKLYTWKEATAWSRKRKEASRPKRDRGGPPSRRSEPASAVAKKHAKKPKPTKAKAAKPHLIGLNKGGKTTRTKELARLAGVVLALGEEHGPVQLEVATAAAAVPAASTSATSSAAAPQAAPNLPTIPSTAAAPRTAGPPLGRRWRWADCRTAGGPMRLFRRGAAWFEEAKVHREKMAKEKMAKEKAEAEAKKKEERCPVCLEEFDENVITMPCCSQSFHKHCLRRCLQDGVGVGDVRRLMQGRVACCPTCRGPAAAMHALLSRGHSGAPALDRETRAANKKHAAALTHAMQTTRDGTRPEYCELTYIGDSTLGSETGFGLFATRALEPDQVIGDYAEGIPLSDAEVGALRQARSGRRASSRTSPRFAARATTTASSCASA